jgi:hypothetical protein
VAGVDVLAGSMMWRGVAWPCVAAQFQKRRGAGGPADARRGAVEAENAAFIDDQRQRAQASRVSPSIRPPHTQPSAPQTPTTRTPSEGPVMVVGLGAGA